MDWLGFDTYNDKTLDYIHECMKHEEVAYQKETTLIRNIDQEKLEQLPIGEKYLLDLEQLSDLVPKLEKLSKKSKTKKFESITLALNFYQ